MSDTKWNNLAKNRERWWAILNAVMDLGDVQNARFFFTN